MKRLDIAVARLRSLAWSGDDLIDWLGGWRLSLEPGAEPQRFGVGSTYRFDQAIGLGDVGVTYEMLGTKGRIARWNGKLASEKFVPLGIDEVREIDRSYYHADDYAYPVCLLVLPDGREAIAHCPRRYDRLDLELLDGTLLTPREGKHLDVFHSRIEASADGRWLLVNGWLWHPINVANVYDVARALEDPMSLSHGNADLGAREAWMDDDDDGICGATLSGERVVCASRARLAVFGLPSGELLRVHRMAEPAGTQLMAWGEDHVVCFDGHARVIELETGATVHRWDDLDGGPGLHQPSVNMAPPSPPWIARDPEGRRFALGWPDRVVVITE